MRIQKQLLLVIIVLFSTMVQAQELTVKSMTASPTDLSASQYRVADLNGSLCGLVKVQIAASGVKFEGNVIGEPEFKTGEYWVYMSEGSYELHIKVPNYLPLELNFRDYDIMRIESLCTYKLIITLPLLPSHTKITKKERIDAENRKSTHIDGTLIETFSVNGVSFNMIQVKGSSFNMGATSEMIEGAKNDEKPVHQVTLSDYCIGETEVTQELWKAVMGKNPSKFKNNDCPVEMVSWYDCQAFVKKLNELTGRQFRLPTEAEWEYAARGGVLSKGYKYAGLDIADLVGWYGGLYHQVQRPHAVRQKEPNELGIYDMTGNVWEWCQDIYGPYADLNQNNPKGASSGLARVFRGGGWSNGEKFCRISERDFDDPHKTSYDIGLRLAL